MGILGPYLRRRQSSPLARGVGEGGFASLGPFFGVMANPPAITTTDGSVTTISSGVLSGPTDTAFKYTSPPLMTWAANTNYKVVGDGTTTDISSLLVVEFLCDAPQVEFRLNRFNTRGNIRVDGELIQDAHLNFDAAGTGRNVKLDWSADANPNKLRLYRISGYNMPFGGVWTTAGYDISYPTARDALPLMAFLGDSYTQVTGANGPDRVYGNTIATALGYDYWADGLGGAGWLTASPSDPVSRIGKRLAVMARVPSVIVTALGYNDSAGSQTTIATNYDSAIAALQADFPSAKIVSLGPWTPLGTTANLITTATTISARAAADSVRFVDIADIINAGNKATYTGGDNTHPVQIGHDYLGRVIAARMKPKLL